MATWFDARTAAMAAMLCGALGGIGLSGPQVRAVDEAAAAKPEDDKPAEAASADELTAEALQAFSIRRFDKALELMDRAVKADPDNARRYFIRAGMHEQLGRHEQEAADYTRIFELPEDQWHIRRGRSELDAASLHQLRGVANFKAGKFEASVKDFDAYLEAHPDNMPHHWQRGISQYYAGKFAEGVKQFEAHRKVNPDDVENAVWHYLCKAKVDGMEKAREALIPITGDTRVPMMQVHALYAGKLTPEAVLAAAQTGDPEPAELNNRLFYAHLYIGLHYEAQGNRELARKHIELAATKYPSEHYMGDVARVHLDMLRKRDGEGND